MLPMVGKATTFIFFPMKKVFTSMAALALLAGAASSANALGFGNSPTPGLGRALRPAAAKAGDAPFEVGTNAVNLGIGFGTSYAYLGSSVSSTPAFSASFERGVVELGPGVIGLGVLAGYQGTSADYFGFKQKSTDVVVAVRGAFHYPVSDKFDAYAGIGIGYRSISYSFDGAGIGSTTANYGGVFSAGFLGGRYFFTDAIGAFAELGYDQTFLKIGLTAKF